VGIVNFIRPPNYMEYHADGPVVDIQGDVLGAGTPSTQDIVNLIRPPNAGIVNLMRPPNYMEYHAEGPHMLTWRLKC